MTIDLAKIVFKGILGGALVGFVIGVCVVLGSDGLVIHDEDFTHPNLAEVAHTRYVTTVLFAFAGVFAWIGPFIAAATFGPWLRHVVYGLVGSIAAVVGVALLAALITGEQPFVMNKGSKSTCIDIARVYGVPTALLAGPVIGLLVGARLRHHDSAAGAQHSGCSGQANT